MRRIGSDGTTGSRTSLVVGRITWYGTHRGNCQGIPPNGKSAAMAGMNLIRIEDGRIAETWVNFDAMGMLQQLGVMPFGG